MRQFPPSEIVDISNENCNALDNNSAGESKLSPRQRYPSAYIKELCL